MWHPGSLSIANQPERLSLHWQHGENVVWLRGRHHPFDDRPKPRPITIIPRRRRRRHRARLRRPMSPRPLTFKELMAIRWCGTRMRLSLIRRRMHPRPHRRRMPLSTINPPTSPRRSRGLLMRRSLPRRTRHTARHRRAAEARRSVRLPGLAQCDAGLLRLARGRLRRQSVELGGHEQQPASRPRHGPLCHGPGAPTECGDGGVRQHRFDVDEFARPPGGACSIPRSGRSESPAWARTGRSTRTDEYRNRRRGRSDGLLTGRPRRQDRGGRH